MTFEGIWVYKTVVFLSNITYLPISPQSKERVSRGSPYAGHTDADIYIRKKSGQFARPDYSVQPGSH